MIRPPRVPLHDLCGRRIPAAIVIATRAAQDSEALRLQTFAISAARKSPRR